MICVVYMCLRFSLLAHIQFGSINQNSNISVSSTNISNKTGDIPVLKEVKFGSLPATDATLVRENNNKSHRVLSSKSYIS